jgi:hypothetical protein
MMRLMGHLLLWAGFLAAAFASVCRLENADSKWQTIPWVWYGLSMIVGIVGIVLLRNANLEADADDERTGVEYSVVQRSLDTVASIVSGLSETRPQIPSEVLRCIDDQCAQPLSDFADARQALVKRFGLKVYADVMTEFASAERYVNRTWSAAADGYVDEVAASLDRANHHLQNARELLLAAERGAEGGAGLSQPDA